MIIYMNQFEIDMIVILLSMKTRKDIFFIERLALNTRKGYNEKLIKKGSKNINKLIISLRSWIHVHTQG